MKFLRTTLSTIILTTLISLTVQAIIPTSDSSYNDLQNLIYNPKAQLNKYIGKVHYSDRVESTTPGAIVGPRRFITFTESLPSKISSIEITEGDQKTIHKEKYTVVKKLEIHSYSYGFLVCCEVDRDFRNTLAIKLPTGNNDELNTTNNFPANLVGYGSNEPQFNELKACFVKTKLLREDMSVFSCTSADLSPDQKKYSGMLGTNDVGSFVLRLINGEWYLMGYAEFTPGKDDFSLPSFNADAPYFRRLLKLPEDIKKCLYQINDIKLLDGENTLDSIKSQLKEIEIPKVKPSNLTPVATDTKAERYFEFSNNKISKLYINKEGIGYRTVLIDTQILLMEGLSIPKSCIIDIDGTEYSILGFKQIDKYTIAKLDRPVLNVQPLMRARKITPSQTSLFDISRNIIYEKALSNKPNVFFNFYDPIGQNTILDPTINNSIDHIVLSDALYNKSTK